ncbi:long-chain fatty acid--CoA ligase [Pseudonocardia alni]|uniref:long-chain fatty acid--CoA ligase n=1 Tax=Pseudonocardia TaxID=1847 RepID=UPI0020979BCB|nr:long-chain fatty acid--CoA ligase [Pseudonocardia sp. McavD-2-B]MCO7192050.1 long-chain fatty acid--CoA ligase [Pseudonocardia sp. McavD-2-B]
MHGQMQDRPLALPHVFHRAEQLFGDKTIVARAADGALTTRTYREWAQRVRRLAAALDALGVSPDGRVGTYCWNAPAHLELYFAVPCSGRILHTLNIRLPADQLVGVVEHGGDEVVVVERGLFAQFWAVVDRLPAVRRVVVVDDGSLTPLPADDRIVDYDTLLAGVEPVTGRFVVDDENRAAAMCHTSGTTGKPKGVLYSHRSTVLHSLGLMVADAAGVGERDVLLPVVPMFHANAWGYPFAAVFAGSTLVLTGPSPTPRDVADLMREQRVTIAAAVPTIWTGVLPELAAGDVPNLRLVFSGGSAVPISLSEAWRTTLGVPLTQGWGMTECSPMVTSGRLRTVHDGATEEEQALVRSRAGSPASLVELRLVDPDTGAELPWDGVARGELQVAGPWVAASYYGEGDPSRFTADGWLCTGDVAVIDGHGFVTLVDRTKDLVKSGGEWISSVELENHVMGMAGVAEAAVIAVPHPKWSERPLACVVRRPGAEVSREDVLIHLAGCLPRWQVPDDVVFLDEVPKTSTGKFDKNDLRRRYADHVMAP